LDSSPSAGAQVPKSTPVRLTVAKAAGGVSPTPSPDFVRHVFVPNIVGSNLDQARDMLRTAGLRISLPINYTSTKDKLPGTVLSMEPQPGKPAPVSMLVSLTVSGIQMTPLNYTHCRQGATVTLTGQGLGPDGSVYLDDQIAPGKIWEPPTVRFEIPTWFAPNRILKVRVKTQDQTVEVGNITVDKMRIVFGNPNCR
jgi:beta-lactam-binding protein with PASTA domain